MRHGCRIRGKRMTTVMTDAGISDAAPGALSPARSLEFSEIIVELPGSNSVFSGCQIAHVSTRDTQRQLRWTELDLYWTRDVRSTRYALINSGKSALYHVSGGPCNTGVSAVVGSLDDHDYMAYQPCPACRVADLEDLPDDAVISIETTRSGIVTARTAEQLVRGLRQKNPPKGQDPPRGGDSGDASGFLSMPAYRLLTEAARLDPDIRNVLRKKTPLQPRDEDGSDQE
jgi:hypothetical protein